MMLRVPREAGCRHQNVSHGLGPQKTLSFFFDVQGNPQQALKDKGVIDSGCSRHMTGNISYLLDFEEINGGYVAFSGNPKGRMITCKGKIKTGNLDFDDVYFVKELKFNLFSVSQICDKKNSVLFTDTECVVLSSNFKLPDKNHVLLRVPSENNMYDVDLKNVVPSEDLICLFAKATLDEASNIESLVSSNLSVLSATLYKVYDYQPVVARNQPIYSACIKENLDGKFGKKTVSTQQYVLLPLWSTGLQDPQNIDVDAAFDVKENETEVYVSLSGNDKPKKHDEKAKREAKGKSYVDLSIGVKDLRDDCEEFLVNSTNRVNTASAPVTAVGPNPTNITNSFNTASPSDTAFWTTALIKMVNDVVKLQALIDRKKVVVTEDIIRQALQLDNVDGVKCLPNEEIFAELARMGYEKPPPTMVRNVDSPSKFLMVGKGFSGVETPLFATMLVQPQATAKEKDEEDEVSVAPTQPSPTYEPSPPLQEPITLSLEAQAALPSSLP
nr:ribonuclease H-like domain-containing protein [Tanacetum cinerariifolium]